LPPSRERGEPPGSPHSSTRSSAGERPMSIAIAILGLGLLVLVHEAGHFFASLAVGLRPRRFYLGFPPALVKVKRRGIEYGIGVVPLGGFVTIPGMHRPISHDAERRFSRAVSEVPALAGPSDRVRRALDGQDTDAGIVAGGESGRAAQKAGIQAGARVVAIDGARVTAENLPDAIAEWHGRPLTVTIERDSRTHVRPKVTAMKTPEGYRLGIVRKGVGV